MGEVTLILQRIGQGDPLAAQQLMPLVYGELHQLAAAKMRCEQAAHTLQPTALVHEAWLRLGGDAQPTWQNRRHFFGAAAEAMRRILIEQARRRQADRRGGGVQNVELAAAEDIPLTEPADVLEVNDALEALAALDPRKAELVKLRYFAGLTIEDTALAMDISLTTAKRWWLFARTWLFAELNGRSGRDR